MNDDERAIRDLIATWLRATAAGDMAQLLELMADDVVFLTPGQMPFGKDAFAANFQTALRHVRIEPTGEVKEIQVAGDLAYCWNYLNVMMTPLQGGEPMRRSGFALTVLRKRQDGAWVVARDANLLVGEAPPSANQAKPRGIQSAVPVFEVASVARSITWYRDVLGFTADPFGPPDDPVFAILRRDGVELMLQKVRGAGGQSRPSRAATRSAESWDAYIRVPDAHGLREAIRARVPDVAPIVTKEYGCKEFVMSDPDGHVLVFGE